MTHTASATHRVAIEDDHLADGRAVRLQARSGRLQSPTAGLARGFVQANLAILPKGLADDFLRFCQRNPKPCPLLAVSDPGDVRAHWRDDLVSFAIGCSFSFEEALMAEGIEVRHVAQGVNVPMYRTSIATRAAGPFSGPMVVSMRPLKAVDAIRAIQITSRYPAVHGAPVHIGDPALIGIADLSRPNYGDAVRVGADEIPVFWACGVTPQSVVAASRPEFCITHAPGYMLVTDLENHHLSVI